MIEVLARENITVSREECNFDRACDTAYRMALSKFDVDDNGHIARVPGAERSCCSVVVEFVKYVHGGSTVGHSHEYTFEARVEKHVDED